MLSFAFLFIFGLVSIPFLLQTKKEPQDFRMFFDCFGQQNIQEGFQIYFCIVNFKKYYRQIILEKLDGIISHFIPQNFSLKIALREVFEFFGILFRTVYKRSLTKEGVDLHYLKKNFVVNANSFIFCIVFSMTILSILVLQNALYCVLNLLMIFIEFAIYTLIFFYDSETIRSHLEFFALLLVIVYIGGICILFLFLILLLNLRFNVKTSYNTFFFLLIILLLLVCILGLFYVPDWNNAHLVPWPHFENKTIQGNLTRYFCIENICGFFLVILLLLLAVILPIMIKKNKE